MCFGAADADADILRRLTTRFVFLANKGTTAHNALREVMRNITNSVIATARNNEAGLSIPPAGENFTVLDVQNEENGGR